jgi:hypothetical protein
MARPGEFAQNTEMVLRLCFNVNVIALSTYTTGIDVQISRVANACIHRKWYR